MSQAAIALAAAAGALATPALAALASAGFARAVERAAVLMRRLGVWCERLLRPLRRAGVEGIVPTDRERLRLQFAAGIAGLGAGLFLANALAAFALALGLAWAASRSLVWRRERYRRRLESGVSAAALALADALAAGRSVRGALAIAGRDLEGPIGHEVRVVARQLALGGETDSVLERLRARTRSRRVDLLVAAVRVQRRSGGSLATLLRGIAATIDERERLEGEARAASAQARFTAVIVFFLPLLGLLLGELASPGILSRMMGFALGAWLMGTALVLQVSGLLVIRRLGRVEA